MKPNLTQIRRYFLLLGAVLLLLALLGGGCSIRRMVGRYLSLVKDNSTVKAKLARTAQEKNEVYQELLKAWQDNHLIFDQHDSIVRRMTDDIVAKEVEIKRLRGIGVTTVTIRDTILVKQSFPVTRPIDTVLSRKHFTVCLYIDSTKLLLEPSYSASISCFFEVKAKLNRKGKPHWPFPNSKFLWGRRAVTTFTCDDSSARFDKNISVKL